MGDFMTFSEYFNALYPYLADGEPKLDFFDEMIDHFIYEDALASCKILDARPDTKRRYIQEEDPNKINLKYAQYLYAKHNPSRYQSWLNKKMYDQDTFIEIEDWLKSKNIEFTDTSVACDDLLESIFFNIGYPNAHGDADIKLPEKNMEGGAESSHLTEHDRELLKEFHIDFDSILEKFIMNGQAGAVFAGGLPAKIDALYNGKWKDQALAFDDLGLQAEILGTIATLKELCNILDPDCESTSGSSVRRLRMKLRNDYVKLHPDNYVNVFPYEAFIDDWDDGDEYEF
ncbi:MAG: hypothetical protein ACI4ET_14215 [Bilifractor sp.]